MGRRDRGHLTALPGATEVGARIRGLDPAQIEELFDLRLLVEADLLLEGAECGWRRLTEQR